MQQGAFADPRLAHDRQPLALGQIEVHAAQNLDLAATFDKGFVQIAHRKQLLITDNFYRIELGRLARRVDAGEQTNDKRCNATRMKLLQ